MNDAFISGFIKTAMTSNLSTKDKMFYLKVAQQMVQMPPQGASQPMQANFSQGAQPQQGMQPQQGGQMQMLMPPKQLMPVPGAVAPLI